MDKDKPKPLPLARILSKKEPYHDDRIWDFFVEHQHGVLTRDILWQAAEELAKWTPMDWMAYNQPSIRREHVEVFFGTADRLTVIDVTEENIHLVVGFDYDILQENENQDH